MKIAVSTYSFNRLLIEKKVNQLELISLAKEMGFDGIEIVEIQPHDGSNQVDYAKQLKAELDRLEMPITNFTFGADFLTGSDGDLAQEIQRVKEQIDIANLLGAKSVRHDATAGVVGLSFEQALPIIVEGCLAVTEYAATKGIRTMIENHGFFSQDSIRVEQLYSAVNHPNFSLLVDMGNFLCVDEDPILAVGRLAPLAGYAHVKDFHVKSGSQANPGAGFFRTRGGNYLRGAIVGHGNVPVEQCLTSLKSAGYQGDIAIEFEGMEDNIPALKICLENLKNYLKA
ncbi:sugar phosphate isomerase/epimerase family protein [Carnobacterium gallinarum]|uniref:sugar phosphate isomerase/epimerase family protein n=1 Tax=Carnobacterium gallinarum TaxID=2749 RepID=UPI0005506AB3|nr:sugar phosphate isomerase/epimerase family protein [Carnobacterium gallinarum]